MTRIDLKHLRREAGLATADHLLLTLEPADILALLDRLARVEEEVRQARVDLGQESLLTWALKESQKIDRDRLERAEYNLKISAQLIGGFLARTGTQKETKWDGDET